MTAQCEVFIAELYKWLQARADAAILDNNFDKWSAYFIVIDEIATEFPFVLEAR